jgi:hypothetical protein
MRKGFDTLSGVVRRDMGQDPLSSEVFIFMNQMFSWNMRTPVYYPLMKSSKTNCFIFAAFFSDAPRNDISNEWLTNVLNRINDCKVNELACLLPGQWGKTYGV